MNDQYKITLLPDNIFCLKGDEFFRCISQLSGEILCEVLKIQLIDSADAFLNTSNVFDIFRFNSSEINSLRNQVCFKTENGDYIIRNGLLTNLSLLTNLLNIKREQLLNEDRDQLPNDDQDQKFLDLIKKNSLLRSLLTWYKENEKGTKTESTFSEKFIDTILYNLTKSPNHYRYSESIR
ncbi:hypothetical protein I4U23_005288 [Adineta vaga]|nr:hypothetical protein I4U23_005288 [Adineta vaga]